MLKCNKVFRTALTSVVMLGTLEGATLCAQSSVNRTTHVTDVEAGFAAQHTVRAASGQDFWMEGGSFEAGTTVWRGLGPAVNVTGTHTGSFGSSGIPLSLITWTAGPRLRVKPAGRVSPYGEALFGVASGFGSVFPNPGGSTASAASFALLAGGGVDVSVRHAFVRVVDVSYLRSQLPNGTNNVQNILRVGAGVGWRFGARR